MAATADLESLQRYSAGQLPYLDDLQAESLYAAGYTYYDSGDYIRAGDLFRLLALARPYAARSWISLGAAHEAVGDIQRAVALYAIATTSTESTLEERAVSFVRLISARCALGEFQEAADDLAALNELPSDAVGEDLAHEARQLRHRITEARVR